MKRSKNYRKNADLVDRTQLYSPLQAANLAKETGSTSKMDPTVEVAIGWVSTRARRTRWSAAP